MDLIKTNNMMNKLGIFLLSACSFILPIKPLVLIVVSLTLLDTMIGIYASIKIDGRESFRSGKLFNIVPKVFFYSVTILISFLVDTYILGGEVFSISLLLSKSASVLWSYIEIKSIDENSQKLGNRPVMEVIKSLITGIKTVKKDINEIKK